MLTNELSKSIDSALTFVSERQPKLAILLIIHLQSEKVAGDYDGFSVVTSYYSDIEFQEILLAFNSIAAYVDISFGEKEFIKKVQNGSFDHLNDYTKVAYAQTAGGMARSRSALIPAFCDLYNIAYCCNDIFTAALLDNKLAANKVLANLGIKLPDTYVYFYKTGWMGKEPPANCKLISKPAYECASIGVTSQSVSVLDKDHLNFIHSLSIKFNQPILVQQFIEGYEIEVPIIELDEAVVLGVSGISLNGNKDLGNTFLSYDTIFDDGFDLYDFKNIYPAVAQKVVDDTIRAYIQLQLKGPVRLDYRVTSDGVHYLMDYNNSPHLGMQHSFAFTMKQLGHTYQDMLRLIVYAALKK